MTTSVILNSRGNLNDAGNVSATTIKTIYCIKVKTRRAGLSSTTERWSMSDDLGLKFQIKRKKEIGGWQC